MSYGYTCIHAYIKYIDPKQYFFVLGQHFRYNSDTKLSRVKNDHSCWVIHKVEQDPKSHDRSNSRSRSLQKPMILKRNIDLT